MPPSFRTADPSDDPHAPLRDDVRLLGTLLGDTVRDQAGVDIYDIVESVRRDAKAGRTGDKDAAVRLTDTLGGLSVEQAVPVARAFAQFLTQANIAEQHHRVRRRRDYLRDPHAPPQRGSLQEAFHRLLDAGVDPSTFHQAVLDTRIGLVLTAHPTEITRRTVLAKEQRIADILAARDHTDLTPEETESLEADLRREILALWGTDELHRDRPTPEDEARGGFAVVEHVLWDAVPAHLRELDRVLQAHTDKPLPVDAAPIRFGSWMGGDRDGNPNVTPETTRRVILLARWMAADLFHRDVDALRAELSLVDASEAMHAEVGEAREPYRALLRQVRDRLVATKRHTEALLDDATSGADPGTMPGSATHPDAARPYGTTDELLRPLRLIHDSLHETGAGLVAEGRLKDTLRRACTFGMHLVRLDIRQESTRHTAAMDAVAAALGHPSYSALDEPARQRACLDILEAAPAVDLGAVEGTESVRDVIDTFRMIADQPREALGVYVISMAARPSDVLVVHALQKLAGVGDPLPVVPLFETLADLEGAGDSVADLLAIEAYRDIVADGLQVMIGYSDSAKDAGMLAAQWALYRAQEALVAVCREHDVPLTVFHGRGGSVGRGGGPAHQAIGSLPPGSVAGSLRVTEQGEVIQARFGLHGIALRTLELYVTAVLEATLAPSEPPRPEWRALMDRMAAEARDAFRGVVRDEDRFVPYFRTATPEQELGRLKIGSRPARRKPTGGLESLRAIPWVFAWTQNRLILPAWLGVGEGLAAGASSDAETLRTMYEDWAFFRATVDLVEMGVAKADPWVARHYHDGLVTEDLKPFGEGLFTAFTRTKDELMRLTGHGRPVDHNPVLRRSIDVRNPYVDPLNLLQVEFLRRVRAGEDERILDALLVTINGVAQGMRNTG